MRDYNRLAKHLQALENSVYPEPELKYHEKFIDNAFGHFVEKGSFKNALDVGCGTGYTLNKFKAAGIKATGITMSEHEVTAQNFIGNDARLMDMNFLDFNDGEFDLVWCRHSLEHSVMPLIALMEFNRVLQPNGHLYVEVPSDNVIHMENLNHYTLFSDYAWQMLFRKAGYFLMYRGQYAVMIQGSKQNDGYLDIFWHYWLAKNKL